MDIDLNLYGKSLSLLSDHLVEILPAGWLGFPYEHKTIASIKIITQ
jgi:hypothetical protein